MGPPGLYITTIMWRPLGSAQGPLLGRQLRGDLGVLVCLPGLGSRVLKGQGGSLEGERACVSVSYEARCRTDLRVYVHAHPPYV